MSIYQRLLGQPFIYNHLRPFVVGGIDWSRLHHNLEAGPEDVILDIGCGTGVAHDYLKGFAAYHGYDTDPVAIDFARKKAGAANVNYECRMVTAAEISRIQPTRIILGGLLHHLNDEESLSLLKMCASASCVKRIATSDVVYLPGQFVSNLLAYFDRGRFVRHPGEYVELINKAGLKIERAETVPSHPERGRALYFMTALTRGGEL